MHNSFFGDEITMPAAILVGTFIHEVIKKKKIFFSIIFPRKNVTLWTIVRIIKN